MDSAGLRILIVDDDAALLKVMERYLARLGYRVDACRSAADAWERVEADPSAYVRALVDLNMPGVRGEELVRRILDANVSIRLVVVSGYPASGGGVFESGRVIFLPKPFAPSELASALER
ncbi:MAG: response regulator [Bryobacteraceae bacterium]